MAGDKEEDTEYLKLPVEDRCVHKLWKARQSGFEESSKLFQQWDEDDPGWKKFHPIIKKFVTDTNAIVQEKGLEATLNYVTNCPAASKNASDIAEGLVAKCLGAPKAKTKDLAKQIALMLCEIEVFDKCIEELLKGLTQKNPKVVSGCLNSLTECLHSFGAKHIKVSPLLKATVPLLDHRDKTVREEGKCLIIESYRWVGPLMSQQLTNVKPVQMTELEAEFAKMAEEGRPKPTRKLRSEQETVAAPGGGGGDVEGGDAADGKEEEEEELDPFDLMTPVDILPSLPKNFYEKVEEKKWSERKEALDALLPLSQTPKIVNGDFNDLSRVLKKFIAKDSNVVNVALATQCLAGIARGLRGNFKSHATQFLPVVLEKFKEKKANVVNALVDASDALFLCLNVEAIQEDCLAALKHKTPSVNSETSKFLARCFSKCPPQLVTNKKMTKGYVLALVDRLTHPDVTVRDAASEALGVLLKFLGEPTLMKLLADLDPIKLAKIKEFEAKAVLTGKPASAVAKPAPAAAKVVKPGGPRIVKPGSAKPKPPPKAAAPKNDDEDYDLGDEPEPAPAKRPIKSAPPAKAGKPGGRLNLVARAGKSTAAPRKKGEEIDLSAPYAANNLKNTRFKEEAKLKVLRWNFTAPRAEFVDQLKEQMITANFNTTLQTQLFHNDFKQHIKALETLSKHIDQDLPALIANIDLILKWITLRFFETNPSVLLKCLDYLLDAFNALAEDSYHMHDIEASSFIPYLINKSGDPKDPVRNGVKNIVKTLCKVYPASKMSTHLMNGLDAKNAKQRAECLDELGQLINSHGSSVLTPSVPACLKDIAKQISDRDNSVRNAALNCIAEAYFKDGEKLYKVIGKMPEKDMAMLEERIKRQAKTRPLPDSVQTEAPPSTTKTVHPSSRPQTTGGSRLQRTLRPNTAPQQHQQQQQQQQQNQQTAASQNLVNNNVYNNTSPTQNRFGVGNSAAVGRARPISGAFTLDLDKIESSLGHAGSSNSGPKLINHNLDDIFNDSPVRLPQTMSGRPRQKFSPPGANNFGSPISNYSRSAAAPEVDLGEMPEAYEMLDMVLSQIFNQDSVTCINAIVQLDELIKDEEKVKLMGKRMDQFLVACYMQYRHVLNTKMKTDNCDQKEVMKLFQFLTMVLMSMYHHQDLTQTASMSSLHDLIHIVVCILLDPNVKKLPESDQLVRALNVLTVKIVERSDRTNVTSALLKLLKESIANPSLPEQYTDLIMKCLWKVIRSLPEWLKEPTFNLDLILSDVHNFLVAFPSSFWKEQQQDVPLKTMKTILHTLVKGRGEEVLDHLTKVPDQKSSELVPYLMKLLNNGIGKENSNGNGQQQQQLQQQQRPSEQKRGGNNSTTAIKFSKSDHETLAEIFRKIGQKECTKQGLQELYNFKQQNPEANLEPFLAKSSQYFKDYIDRGLQGIEAEVKRGGSVSSSFSNNKGVLSDAKSNSENQDASSGGAAPYSQYLDRLQKLRKQGGLDKNNEQISNYRIATVSSSSSSSSRTVVNNSERYESSSSNLVESVQETAGDNSSQEVEDIRKRLERIKQQAF